MWLIWTILIGIFAGFLAGKVVKGHGMGVLMDLLVGIVGSGAAYCGRQLTPPSVVTNF